MKATRFSMTLYISLPVLASACSVVMIAHFVLLAEGRIEPDGRYGDLFSYLALSKSFSFFGSDPVSFRVLMPLISGTLAAAFGLAGKESIGLLTGSLNFVYLLIGFGWMYYLAMKEKKINALEVALPTFLLLPMPAFWQGIFLPVPDALLFCLFGLVLMAILRRLPWLLIPVALIGVWASEWMFLAALIVPLVDYLRGSVWLQGYFAFALAALIYLAIPLFTHVPEGHMIYRTDAWLAETAERFSGRETSVLRAFWLTFTLSLGLFAYRIFIMGWNRVTVSLSIYFLTVFFLVYLIAPDNVHRVMFMTMPMLVLWLYRRSTFRAMDEPINRAKESAMG